MTQPETNAQRAATLINRHFPPQSVFASAFYGWAGTPWRPGDTDVYLLRCWAEGDILHIETTKPYGEEGLLLLSIHHPSSQITVDERRLVIGAASKVVLQGEEHSPREGFAFETK